MDSNCDGTFKTDGTGDYGYIKSVSGKNTVFTIYTKDRDDFSSVKTSDAVNMSVSSDIPSEETLFLGAGNTKIQTCLTSATIDPASGFFAVANYNEPNINFNKIYKDAFGVEITGSDLADYLKSTKFIMYATVGGEVQYVKANKSGDNYVFDSYVSSRSSATQMTFSDGAVKSKKGYVSIIDVPTSASNGRTYTIETCK